jgi:hypothetical protein
MSPRCAQLYTECRQPLNCSEVFQLFSPRNSSGTIHPETTVDRIAGWLQAQQDSMQYPRYTIVLSHLTRATQATSFVDRR